MGWTADGLLLGVVTRRGSLALLTRCGEPILISVSGSSLDIGPSYYLPLHPRIFVRFVKKIPLKRLRKAPKSSVLSPVGFSSDSKEQVSKLQMFAK